MTTPVTVDVNVFITAVAGGNDAFHSWPSPPPVRGNPAANVLGILNDAREFSLFASEHILANTVRVLCGTPPGGYGWEEKRAEQYIQVIVDIAEASGGGIIEPDVTVTDCLDYEDNRILECAAASGSVLIVSDDSDLLSMSPWRGTPVLTSAAFVKRTDIMRRGHRRLSCRNRRDSRHRQRLGDHAARLCHPARSACLCGETFGTPDELDQHFHDVFLPDDDIGVDGRPHAELVTSPPALRTLT